MSHEIRAQVDQLTTSSSSDSSQRPKDTSSKGNSQDVDTKHPNIQAARCVLYALEEAKAAGDHYRLRSLNWLLRNRRKWTCQKTTGNGESKHNADIAKNFDEIADVYNAMGSQENNWKERSFRSMATRIRKHRTELLYEWQVDDMKKQYTKGMTDKMIGYIKETLRTGTFQRKESLVSGVAGERLASLAELQCIHGIGKVAATNLSCFLQQINLLGL